jgi:hypothetical protein
MGPLSNYIQSGEIKTKIRIFNTKVKSVLLYACETWRLTKQITDMMQSLRRIINIRWPETISNEDLRTVTNQQSIDVQIKKRKWNGIGHTLRKPTEAVEKTALDWNPGVLVHVVVPGTLAGRSQRSRQNMERSEKTGSQQDQMEEFH